MRSRKLMTVILCALFAIILTFAGCADKDKEGVLEFEIGKGLPVWTFNEPRTLADLPDDAASLHLTRIYGTDTDHADVYVYEYAKEDYESLEEIGKELADEYDVYCNMMFDKNYPVANFIYYDAENERIAQNYVYEGEDAFVNVSVRYKTEKYDIASSGLSFRLPKGYSVKGGAENSPFPYDVVYSPNSVYLPTVSVRYFAKDYFTSESYDTARLSKLTKEEYDELASDGWTLEDELALYEGEHELERAEIKTRNGFDMAFAAYNEKGNMYVKAILDAGDHFVIINAEDKLVNYQHIVNALVDTISEN